MADFAKLNITLFETSQKIQIKNNEVEDARIKYLTTKDEYERDYSLAILTIKTKNTNATQTDVKAEATCQTYQKKFDMRTAEATYRRLMAELKSLNTTLESLEEVSYNLRSEAKMAGKIYG